MARNMHLIAASRAGRLLVPLVTTYLNTSFIPS